MLPNKELVIKTGFEPDSLIERQFAHEGWVFELVSILGAGGEGIVYKARAVHAPANKPEVEPRGAPCPQDMARDDGPPLYERALKVFRRKLSEEEFRHKQDIHRMLETAGVPVIETHFFYLDGWPVVLMPVFAHIIHFGARMAASKQYIEADCLNEIVDRINAGDFAEALRRCDELLEHLPLQPDALRLKGIALFGLGQVVLANESLRLCFEVAPDSTEHYVAVIKGATALGQFACAHRYARQGLERAVDRRAIYRAWFTAEQNAERVGSARLCLEQLRSLGEPEASLDEMRMQLHRIEAHLACCEREVQGGWHLLQQRRLDEAEQIAHRLKREHPYHVSVLLFAGVVAFEQRQWAEATSHLHCAFLLQPMSNPVVPFLLVHTYLRLGKIHHAIVKYSVWQQYQDEAMMILQERDLRDHHGAGASAASRLPSERERWLVRDWTSVAQQGRSILSAFDAVCDSDPETQERVVPIIQRTKQLLAWLGQVSSGEGAR